MKKILILFGWFIPVTLMAQGLSGQVKVGMPATLNRNIISEKDIMTITQGTRWGQGNATKKYWDVRSDQANNITYERPSKEAPQKGYLTFGQKVRIAEISNDQRFAHVYEELQLAARYPNINDPVDLGWVPMDNLLLWSKCPVNEKRIYNKALIVVNLNENSKENKGSIFLLYNSPNKEETIGALSTCLNFRFVMKEDKKTGRVLLANYHNFEDAHTQTDLLFGWVNKQTYIKWNQRSCLEPNWLTAEVQYFQKRDDQAILNERGDFSGKNVAYLSYGTIGNKDGLPIDKYRMPKNALRYPILDKDNQVDDTKYKCTMFASNGSITDAVKYQEKYTVNRNSRVADMESINLIICIDGTKSMEPYYEPIKEAIKKGYGSLEAQKFSVKVGVVIYRDYTDGENVTEVLPLKKHTDPEIADFLDKGGKSGYGIASSPNDKTAAEALYAGLMKATDPAVMGFKEKESNFMIVVGDCGNDLQDKKYDQQQIIQRLVSHKFQMSSFQVRRLNFAAYNWFQDQMSNIIVENIKNQLASIDSKYKEKVKFVRDKEGRGYEVNDGLEKLYYTGSLIQPKLGNDMQPEKLSQFVQENLRKYGTAISNQRELQYQVSANTQDSVGSHFDRDYLISRYGQESYDLWKQTNSIMSYQGYTYKKNKDGHDYWKTVVYMSKEELSDLILKLENIYNVARKQDYENRKPYIDAIKALIKTMVPDIQDAEMNEMTPDQVMGMIIGDLNARTKSMESKSLKAVLDPNVVDNQEYANIVRTFANRYENLSNIKTTYKFRLESNGQTYYWIPTDMLP